MVGKHGDAPQTVPRACSPLLSNSTVVREGSLITNNLFHRTSVLYFARNYASQRRAAIKRAEGGLLLEFLDHKADSIRCTYRGSPGLIV